MSFKADPAAAAAGLGTGPGALVISTGGALVAGHGAAVGAAATADAGMTTSKLLKLEGFLKATAPKMSARAKSKSEHQGDLHHISTNKTTIETSNRTNWTDKFKEIFKKARLDIDKGSENLVRVLNHQGPHPEIYHEQVYYRLLRATQGKKGDTNAYKNAVIKELQRIGLDCATPGTFLNSLITKGNIL